jgi:hypothetical protein
MSDSSTDLPEVEARDPESVAVAIETARALFRTGDRLDALRWIRRAAERAEEAGDDLRAVNLARSAADLSTELQSQPPPPPPPPLRRDEAAALSHYDDFSDKTAVDAPAATAIVREALQSGIHITELPSSSAPPSVTLPSPPSTPTFVPSTTLKAQPDSGKPTPRQALRVAVAPDPESPGSWLVRALAEGVPAAPGSEEALLVLLDPQSKLFQ